MLYSKAPFGRSFDDDRIRNSSTFAVLRSFGVGRSDGNDLGLILRECNPTVERGGTECFQACGFLWRHSETLIDYINHIKGLRLT